MAPRKSELLCLKSQTSRLDRVSTTCGSGWVMDQIHKTLGNRARLRRTHPLPQVVLTRSKNVFALLRQGRPSNNRKPVLLALAASFLLTVLIVAGSRNLEHYDSALFGYTIAGVVALGAIVFRYAIWLQPYLDSTLKNRTLKCKHASLVGVLFFQYQQCRLSSTRSYIQ